MRRIGQVVRATGTVAVARSRDDSYPDVGTELIDEDLEDAGQVVDVFGPVGRPYLAVVPEAENPATLVGRTVYAR
ncbi:H/ACA RNA-protein complex component Gar1 [Halobacteriales archaeon QH_10_65_19]|jgi:RNA-binding protein|nr:MAG: H/ACA RNA-protein complex component Gar1 [Halobacteriales archaeon QH_10_65_19]